MDDREPKTFQQQCPSCHRRLELPFEADGQAAVCPACETEFVAIANRSGESIASSEAEPTSSPPQPLPVEPSQSRRVAIETIFVCSRTLFFERQSRLLLPFLVPGMLVAVGVVAPLLVFDHWAQSDRRSALTGVAIGLPFFVAILAYALWSALKLAEGLCERPQLPDAESSRAGWLPSAQELFGCAIVTAGGLAVLAAVLAIAAALISQTSAIKALEFRLLVGAVIVFVAVFALLLFAMRFWPMVPLAREIRRRSGLVQASLKMTGMNLTTSFLIVAASACLLGLGFCLFGLGLLVTIPLTALLLTCAQRLIQNKPIPALEVFDEVWR